MRTGKGSQEEEDYGQDEFGSKREGPSSNAFVHGNNNNNTAASKDAKNSDRANAIRSKHSVTEQRRRCKINERFQILRELIPHGDQKRDTASFLLEVIEYVQYLQEKVQKYEGSYPGWTPEPTKLMPWRNSHWRAQSFANHPQGVNDGSGPGTLFPGKFEENNITSVPTIMAGIPSPQVESDPSRDIACRPTDRQSELENKVLSLPTPVQPITPLPVHGAQSNECPATSDVLSQNEDLVIEGGTISISSIYSHELLTSMTQALQKAGIDLSHAKLSVQIDLGKGANQGLTSALATTKNPLSETQAVAHPRDPSGDESDQTHKRIKT